MAQETTWVHTEVVLAPGGVFLSDPFQLGTDRLFQKFAGMAGIKGYVNSPQQGNLDVYQGSKAEIDAIIAAVPPVSTSDGTLRLRTFNHVAGAAAQGDDIVFPCVAPWIRARYTNGVVQQTSFRLHLEASE